MPDLLVRDPFPDVVEDLVEEERAVARLDPADAAVLLRGTDEVMRVPDGVVRSVDELLLEKIVLWFGFVDDEILRRKAGSQMRLFFFHVLSPFFRHILNMKITG